MSHHASSDNEKDWDDGDDQEIELGKLSQSVEPTWVIGTLSEMVQPDMARSQLQLMKLEELAQYACGYAANYILQ